MGPATVREGAGLDSLGCKAMAHRRRPSRIPRALLGPVVILVGWGIGSWLLSERREVARPRGVVAPSGRGQERPPEADMIFVAIVGPRPDPYPTVEEPRWPKPGPMPAPRVLLLREEAGGVIVYGYAADGTFAGDTWFESIDVAKDASEQRYREGLGPWRPTHEPFDAAVMTALREASRSGAAR